MAVGRIQGIPHTREELKVALQAEGKWRFFLKFRDDQKRNGLAPTEAYKAALCEYPPLALGYSADISPKGKKSLRVPNVNLPLEHTRFWTGANGGPRKQVVEVIKNSVEKQAADAIVLDANQINLNPEAGVDPDDNDLISRKESKLATRYRPQKKTSKDLFEEILWIHENMGVKNLTYKDAPSAGAYAYLKECQQDKVVRQSFRKDVFTKCISTKSISDEADKVKMTGRTAISLIERIKQKMEEKHEEDKRKEAMDGEEIQAQPEDDDKEEEVAE